VLDLYDRKVIGWSMSKDMSAENTSIKAMKMALTNRKPSSLIFHSDRGIQYACDAFTALLHQHRIRQSMSRKGNCWDNAVAESFFKTLKGECTDRYQFKSIAEAKTAVFSYIEGWYNRGRIHSSLGYVTPLQKQTETTITLA
jgi:transposase InsO family protein